MARPELPGAAAPIQPPVSPFRWAARTHFSNLLPKCSFIFRMVVVYWSWNCESCPEIKYFSLFLRTALLFQLIPARGRKPGVCAVTIALAGISTYPRKGTETVVVQHVCSIRHGFHLIPARGRKQEVYFKFTTGKHFILSPQGDGNALLTPFHFTEVIISTYPRKGTETCSLMLFAFHWTHFNLSPQGDGNWNTPE